VYSELLNHPDPIVRFRYRTQVLEEDPRDPGVEQLQDEIRTSPRVQALLCDRSEKGEITFHPYTKWQGAHWVLTVLADTGYPAGDEALLPLREQVFGWLLSEEHVASIRQRTGQHSQVRLHASMEANAIFAALQLGLADERVETLVERLLWSQWPDGGWNCDRKAKADTSSFYESITPLRALACYARRTGDPHAQAAAERAAEIFLQRHLYRRLSDGSVMKEQFLKLCTPTYWYYDVLFGLKVMAEAGFIGDPRCQQALDWLEVRRLPEGGFAADSRHYTVNHTPGKIVPRGSRADWGVVSRRQPNEFVTLDALYVLRAAGRL
jgi:hypothetical protein